MTATPYIPLRLALLCLEPECEVIFQQPERTAEPVACPACASRTVRPVAPFLDRSGDKPAGMSDLLFAYKETSDD